MTLKIYRNRRNEIGEPEEICKTTLTKTTIPMKSILPTKLSFLFAFAAAVLIVWAHDSFGSTQVIAVSGEAAPDGNGVFRSFTSPVVGASGQVTFTAFLDQTAGDTADDSGSFLFSGGQLATLAREGHTATSDNEVHFFVTRASLNGTGQAVFDAFLSPVGGPYAGDVRLLRFADPGGFFEIARVGQAAPDGNGTISGILNRSAPNGSGQSVFLARFVGAPGAGNTDSGILVGNGATPLDMIARVGQISPGGGNAFYLFEGTALNDAGQVAFLAALDSPNVSKPTGIYLSDAGDITPIVESGQAAPGGNGTFASMEHIGLSAAGKVSFRGNLTGTSGGNTDNVGVYIGDGAGSVVEVARKGQPGPGISGTILDLSRYAPVMNSLGQLAFVAVFQTGVEDGHAVLRTTPGGELQEVLRGGMVSPDGNGRVVFSAPAINNLGQMVFYGIATDTSGGVDDFGTFADYDDRFITSRTLGENRDRIIMCYDDQLGLLKVVREGDPMLGSTVSRVSFAGGSFFCSQCRKCGPHLHPHRRWQYGVPRR